MASGMSIAEARLTPKFTIRDTCGLLSGITDPHGQLVGGKTSFFWAHFNSVVEDYTTEGKIEDLVEAGNMSMSRLLEAYYLRVVCDAQVAGAVDPFWEVPECLLTGVKDLIKHLCSGGENLAFWLGDPTSIPFAYHPFGPIVLGKRLVALEALSQTLV